VSVIDILFMPRRPVHERRLHVASVESMTLWYQQWSNEPSVSAAYSHSIVAGGLDEMS
jgi:hypothetical protein